LSVPSVFGLEASYIHTCSLLVAPIPSGVGLSLMYMQHLAIARHPANVLLVYEGLPAYKSDARKAL
jgi:hypothetical protein